MTAAGIVLMIIGILIFVASFIRDVWLVEVKDTTGMIYLLLTDFLLYGTSLAMIILPVAFGHWIK